jgi:hypothetical protein
VLERGVLARRRLEGVEEAPGVRFGHRPRAIYGTGPP